MAIDTGILVGCSGLQSVGGIRQIIVGDIVDIDTVTTGTGHSYDALTTASGQAHAKFEFRNESASMNISTSKENGNTTHEITLSWYLPNTDGTAFEILKEMETACMFAVVEGINGTKWALGISEKYATGANSGSAAASANFADYFNYAELTSVEGGLVLHLVMIVE